MIKRWWMRFWHRQGLCPVCRQWVYIGMTHSRPATWTARPLHVKCSGIAL